MDKDMPDLPQKTKLELWRLAKVLQLPELLVLERLLLGLDWQGEVFNDPAALDHLTEWALLVKTEPLGKVYLTPQGRWLAEVVQAVWPQAPKRGAAKPSPPAKAKPRPQLKLVKPSR